MRTTLRGDGSAVCPDSGKQNKPQIEISAVVSAREAKASPSNGFRRDARPSLRADTPQRIISVPTVLLSVALYCVMCLCDKRRRNIKRWKKNQQNIQKRRTRAPSQKKDIGFQNISTFIYTSHRMRNTQRLFSPEVFPPSIVCNLSASTQHRYSSSP